MSRQDVIAKPIPRSRKDAGRDVSGNPGLAMVSISHSSAVTGIPRSSVVTGLIWLLALAAVLATALLSAADRFWIGDMIIFFRPQLALAVLLLLCTALWLRRWTASA